MKNKILLIACFLLMTNVADAQRVSAGIKAGANFTNFEGVDNSESKTGFTGGGFLVYSLIEEFGISADLLYSSEGAEFGTTSSDGTSIFSSEYQRTLHYLRVPLLANYFFNDLGDVFRPKISLGPSFGFLLSAKDKVETKTTSNGYVTTSASSTQDAEGVKGFDLSAVVGTGFNYRLADRHWLNFDVRYLIGATDLREEQDEGDAVKNRGFSVTLGFAFGFGEIN